MVTNLEPFKKLYGELLSAVKDYSGDICTFFPQTGKKYYEADKKLLFAGKSVNGWLSHSRDVEELFDPQNEDRIANRDDEIEWIENMANTRSGYNTNRSAFLRVVKRIALEFYGKEDWYNHIAWTNVYKISPCEGGNPSEDLRQMQEALCVKILNEEIKALKPDFVIFLTSQLENFYLESIGLDPQKNQAKVWGDHATRCQTKDGITYIMSPHPQGKDESTHTAAILEILNK